MRYSFDNHIVAIQNRVSPDLLSDANCQRLKNLCFSFPFDTATEFGFEIRLGNPDPESDFFLRVLRESAGAAMLGGKSKYASLSPELLEYPLWIRISELFRAWSDSSSVLAKGISLFWLEFDFADNSYNPVPNLFFYIREPETGKTSSNLQAIRRVLDEMYQILFGFPFPKDLDNTLKHSLNHLPKEARLYQTGFMIPRKTEAVRLVLVGLNRETIFPYLDRIGWSGEPDRIEELLNDFGPRFDSMLFNVDIGREILPHLGTELYFDNKKQPKWEPRWSENLDLLESQNLLLPAKRRGLAAYSGKNSVNYLVPLTYINLISHLKIVYKIGSPIECKGYLGTLIRQLP